MIQTVFIVVIIDDHSTYTAPFANPHRGFYLIAIGWGNRSLAGEGIWRSVDG